MTSYDPLAGGKVPEFFLNFQRYFFPENDVLECAYFFFCINKFTCHKKTFLGVIINFAKSKNFFFEISC